MVGAYKKPSCGKGREPIHSILCIVAQTWMKVYIHFYSIIQGADAHIRPRSGYDPRNRLVAAHIVRHSNDFYKTNANAFATALLTLSFLYEYQIK